MGCPVGSLSRSLAGPGVCTQGHPGPRMPKNAQADVPSPGPRGVQVCWVFSPQPRSCGPHSQAQAVQAPEGLVRKEGNAVRLPWADCFLCSCEGRGGNAAPPSRYDGVGKVEHPPHQHKPGGPPTPTPAARTRPSVLHLPLTPVSSAPGPGQALDTDPDTAICKKFQQNSLVPNGRS